MSIEDTHLDRQLIQQHLNLSSTDQTQPRQLYKKLCRHHKLDEQIFSQLTEQCKLDQGFITIGEFVYHTIRAEILLIEKIKETDTIIAHLESRLRDNQSNHEEEEFRTMAEELLENKEIKASLITDLEDLRSTFQTQAEETATQAFQQPSFITKEWTHVSSKPFENLSNITVAQPVNAMNEGQLLNDTYSLSIDNSLHYKIRAYLGFSDSQLFRLLLVLVLMVFVLQPLVSLYHNQFLSLTFSLLVLSLYCFGSYSRLYVRFLLLVCLLSVMIDTIWIITCSHEYTVKEDIPIFQYLTGVSIGTQKLGQYVHVVYVVMMLISGCKVAMGAVLVLLYNVPEIEDLQVNFEHAAISINLECGMMDENPITRILRREEKQLVQED